MYYIYYTHIYINKYIYIYIYIIYTYIHINIYSGVPVSLKHLEKSEPDACVVTFTYKKAYTVSDERIICF